MSKPLLKLGTRGSALAMAQTHEVIAALTAGNADLAAPGAIEIVTIRTSGDKIQDRALADQGGKGLFVKEIEDALADGIIDAGVHSSKDIPTRLPTTMRLGCVLPRADARDAFFSAKARTLEELVPKSIVGTASPRRQALILAKRPDLMVILMRGNVDTRLRKLDLGEVDATVLAVAGLQRLGLEHRIQSYLDPTWFVPASGQGTIALEIRAPDQRTAALLAPAHDRQSGLILEAERAVLYELDGSCNSPIAAWGRVEGTNFVIDGLAAQPDGTQIHRHQLVSRLDDMVATGAQLGRELKARLPADFFAAA
jgi:hydroxymethylbilane synthase